VRVPRVPAVSRADGAWWKIGWGGCLRTCQWQSPGSLEYCRRSRRPSISSFSRSSPPYRWPRPQRSDRGPAIGARPSYRLPLSHSSSCTCR